MPRLPRPGHLRLSQLLQHTTLTPFLYPTLLKTPCLPSSSFLRHQTYSTATPPKPKNSIEDEQLIASEDYTLPPFVDIRPLTLHSGSGGNGCISFHREKFVAHGPPNGGDGGRGGNIYIQAIYGEDSSLHKLGRGGGAGIIGAGKGSGGGTIKAGDGKNGMGKARNGKRGDDVIIRVPVGTVVRELWRCDPNTDTINALEKLSRRRGGVDEEGSVDVGHGMDELWVHYPLALAKNMQDDRFASARYPLQHFKTGSENLKLTHPQTVFLDLDKPTPEPILLVPGAAGGLGNPHFITQNLRSPKFATKGAKGLSMQIQLELKMLADVGLVGLPNAGKSSFLRAVSRKKARVGNWAFTTLTPNLGTVSLGDKAGEERFSIADIPGLVRDAHRNKGLGVDFLRHVERARVLAFVVDLSSKDPVGDLCDLWKECVAFENGWNVEGGMMDEMMGVEQEQAARDELWKSDKLTSSETDGLVNDEIDAQTGPTSTLQASTTPPAEMEAIIKLKAQTEQIWDTQISDEMAQLMKNELEESSEIPAEPKSEAPPAPLVPPKPKVPEKIRWTGVKSLFPNYIDTTISPPPPQTLAPIAQEPTSEPSERATITTKPFLIVANKADLPETQEAYAKLDAFINELTELANREHFKDRKLNIELLANDDNELAKRGIKKAIREGLRGQAPLLIPVCAKKGEGVEGVVDGLKALLGY